MDLKLTHLNSSESPYVFSNSIFPKTPDECRTSCVQNHCLSISHTLHNSFRPRLALEQSGYVCFLARWKRRKKDPRELSERVTDINTRGVNSGITCAFSMNIYSAETNGSINIPFSSRRKGQPAKDHSTFQVRLERNCWPRPEFSVRSSGRSRNEREEIPWRPVDAAGVCDSVFWF